MALLGDRKMPESTEICAFFLILAFTTSARRTADPDGRKGYRAALRNLQIELVKVQRHVIKHGHKVLVIFEGRDASGKDGTIKRIVQHLSPRETRVVALGKP